MVVLSANSSAFLHQGILFLQSKFPATSATKVDYHQVPSLTSRTVSLTKAQYSYRNHIAVVSATRNDRQLSINDELFQEPFLLTMIKETIWGIKSLFTFLVEQPSQLKYIEWPSFSNTLRTATLTLVLVALLIVALASVDSALCFLLALVLRKA